MPDDLPFPSGHAKSLHHSLLHNNLQANGPAACSIGPLDKTHVLRTVLCTHAIIQIPCETAPSPGTAPYQNVLQLEVRFALGRRQPAPQSVSHPQIHPDPANFALHDIGTHIADLSKSSGPTARRAR